MLVIMMISIKITNHQSNRDHPARHHHDEESIKSERRANPTSLGAQPPSDFQASMRGCHT